MRFTSSSILLIFLLPLPFMSPATHDCLSFSSSILSYPFFISYLQTYSTSALPHYIPSSFASFAFLFSSTFYSTPLSCSLYFSSALFTSLLFSLPHFCSTSLFSLFLLIRLHNFLFFTLSPILFLYYHLLSFLLLSYIFTLSFLLLVSSLLLSSFSAPFSRRPHSFL